MNYCLIAAAGSGSRMHQGINANTTNTLPKQFIEINGVPTIIYTLKTVVELKKFDKIFIAVNRDYYYVCKEIIEKYGYSNNVTNIVYGGTSRIDTFFNLMDAVINNNSCNSETDLIMFLDANRPFTPHHIYNQLINSCKKECVAVPAMNLVDGICMVKKDHIEKIPDKSELYTFQTPECFTLKSYQEILASKGKKWMSHYLGVAEIYLAYGIKPKIIYNDRLSMKITYDIDIFIAEQISNNLFS